MNPSGIATTQTRLIFWKTIRPEAPVRLSLLSSFLTFLLIVHGEEHTVKNDIVPCPLTPGESQEESFSMLRKDLFTWCTEDAECAYLYQQSYRKNETVFRHLTDPQFSNLKDSSTETYYKPLEALLCNEYTVHEINKHLWLFYLKSTKDKSQPMCDVNHQLVFYGNDLKSACMCKPDRICTDQLYDQIPFYIALVLIVILSVIFVVGNLVISSKVLRNLEKTTNKETALGALSKTITYIKKKNNQ